MKIIHCADLHLDSKLTANLPKDKIESRKAELLHTFLRMIDYANVHEVKAVLISGDLYDTTQISKTAINTVYEAVKNNPHIDFYYLRGNHDTEEIFQKNSRIPKNLRLFTDAWSHYEAEETGKVVISGAELTKENCSYLYNSLDLNPEQFHIVMLHGQETEYKGKDKTVTIPLRHLKNKNIDYLALGHVHEYKWDTLDARGRFCYAGCLEGRGFDECGEHGFVLLDIDVEHGTFTHEFVPIAYRNLYTLSVDVTGCMTTFDVSDRINEALEKNNISEKNLVKVVLTGKLDIACELNMTLLLHLFEQDYYFFKIYDESDFFVDYTAFALDASLKGEFVRQVMGDETLREEDKAAIVRYGIQALAGEELK